MMKASAKTILGLALASVALAASNVAMAEKSAVSTEGGLKVYEGDFWFKLNGRLQFDEVLFTGDNSDRNGYASGANIRRAEITTKGGFNSDWSYKFQLDFADQASRTAEGGTHIKEAFLAYVGMRDVTLALGQISAPVGLEGWTSADAQTFMEASTMTYAFAPNYGLGVYADYVARQFTLAAAIYNPADEAVSGGGNGGSDKLGMAARITFSPIHTENDVWHFGLSGLRQNAEAHSSNRVSFGSIPEARARNAVYSVGTGVLTGVEDYSIVGVEGAYLRGPASVQAEYQALSINRLNADNLNFDGFYVQASYVLTGESRPYDFDSGTFENVKPRMPCGAWEVAARYSYVGFEDSNVAGGAEHNTSVGVNWYANNNLKFQADYTRATIDATADVADDNRDLDIFGFRAQVVW